MRRRSPLEVGAKYNDWTVVVQLSLVVVTCECKCGNKCNVIITHLLSGRSKRCRTCANKRPNYKWRSPRFDDGVGKYPAKLKTAVTDAIRRCTNEDDENYNNWGGRGIKVHQEWLDDPRLFIEYLMTLVGWDNPELVIDRINNDGNYAPGNLRWATYLESCRNQRRPATRRKKVRGEFSM
jgi:hypothetical protein